MRLRKIRLAGFKSFVDPTTISLPGDLIGIVGPNGCGKSNVIDAVRWVMGEISAKHLRGDTMADVVFTGSNTRKPTAQASVELVFDNADGRIGGRYAEYAEIAVRRQVARDGQSSYYLNGTRCRRRDVMDVFFGTGLGPRSYAIIEQGMISRLIEARPEELRDFLEEAAGISKYKERRRETENRMRHTRENLDRLEDIREELDKRLTHLKRQATMAERYKEYKQEQRRLGAELAALRWRTLDADVRAHEEKVGAQETRLEATRAEQRRVETALERAREDHSGASEHFNDVYRRMLEAGAEIARGEESIQGLRQRRDELGQAAEREARHLEEAKEHLAAAERRAAELDVELERLGPELERLQAAAGEARVEFRNREEALHHWQSEWESLSERAAQPSQAKHAEEARIEHLEANLEALRERLAALEHERAGLDVEGLEVAIANLDARLGEEEAAVDEREQVLAARRETVRAARERQQEAAAALHVARERLQELRGQLASLQALQQDALGKGPGAVTDWLRSRALETRPRLAETLEVDAGWDRAVEVVLATRLEAVCVESLEPHARDIEDLSEGEITLLAPGAGATPARADVDHDAEPLAAHVRSWSGTGTLLHGVYAAGDREAALRLREKLRPGESVVTRDGLWLGPDWLHAAPAGGEGAGVIAREQQIHTLSAELETRSREVARSEEAVGAAGTVLREAEDAQQVAEEHTAAGHRAFSALRAELGAERARLEQSIERAAALRTEIADVRSRLEAEEQVLTSARARLRRSAEEVERLTGERAEWELRRQEHRDGLESARERWHELRDEAYQVGLRAESMRAQRASLGEASERGRAQVSALQQRLGEIEKELGGLDAPLAEANARLEKLLAQRREVEEELRGARERVEELEVSVRELDRQRAEEESRVATEREMLERVRLGSHEARVRRQTVEEQLARDGHDAAALLETLEAGADEDRWEESLAAVERRITRLGPINLAAIEEHEQQTERKHYLDAQHSDLQEALETLTSAIQKIDRETRSRFKETYEKVNEGLRSAFPRLFAGGTAYLELTGDDLLSAGIAVMARPPGKRNTSIQLLSGGEKALTAVALVFSIFELNPAPFCLLDEVDAPLDDTNVARFCDLVREMSERVQFVIVTHNKITMEMTHQLIGVTMNEPGVSRLVAVDVDEAVELAAV